MLKLFYYALLISTLMTCPFLSQSCSPEEKILARASGATSAKTPERPLPGSELLNVFEEKYEAWKSKVKRKKYAILIDYEKSILETRLWLINLKADSVELCAKVSHAYNSGVLYAVDFSNTPDTEKSCVGCFITAEPYTGSFGYSMKLKGLEKGINDNAYKRYIVFHQNAGLWSLGCFMTEKEINKKLIDLTNGGSFVYVHTD